jgi:hypothetical protein
VDPAHVKKMRSLEEESRFRGNGNGSAFSSEVDPAHVKKM